MTSAAARCQGSQGRPWRWATNAPASPSVGRDGSRGVLCLGCTELGEGGFKRIGAAAINTFQQIPAGGAVLGAEHHEAPVGAGGGGLVYPGGQGCDQQPPIGGGPPPP